MSLSDQPDAQDLSGSLVTLGTTLAVTDAQGAFHFDQVQQGDVKLRVTRSGYVSQERSVTVTADQTATADFALELPEVPNTAPVISSISIAPQQLKPNGTASVVVMAADEDGDALNFTFSADSGFTIAPGTESGRATVTAPAVLDAKGTLTVVVDDGKGGTATGKLEISTSQNTQPTLTSVTARPSAVKPGGTIELSAVAKDVESNDLSYAWTAPVGWTVNGSGANATLVAPKTYGASGLVTLEVSDGSGGKVSGQVTVATIPNAKPVVTSVTATPSQVAPNGTIALDVSAYDPHGDALTYAWTAPAGWTLQGTGASVTLTAPAQYGQVGTMTVDVEDGNGGVVQAQIVVSTAQNQAPVLSSLTAAPPTVQKGGTVQLAASAFDPDGDALSYTWTAPSGWTLTPNGPQANLIAPNAAAQVGTVTLTVRDGQGGTVTGSLVVSTAANHGPIISSITATPATVARGGTTQITVSASDPDGDALSYAWTVPSGWTLTGTGKTVSVTAPAISGQAGTVRVTVTDTTNAQASGSVVVSTSVNSAPVISSVTANPQPVAKDGNVTLSASASDADGDGLTYGWTAPSGWTLTGTGATVTLRAPSTPGATGSVQLTVTDGFGGSTTGSVVVSTRANSAPILSSITATPATVGKGGTVQLMATASDADSDPLTWAWSVPNGWTLTGTGANVSVTAPNVPGSTATVQVTVSDGSGGSTTGSVVVSTQPNTAPTLSSLVASPQSIKKGATATVQVSASDADRDSLSYVWSASAGWTISATGAVVSVTAPNTPGTTGTISVVVSDGFGGTSSGSVVITTVANHAPTVSSLIGTPNPVARGGTVALAASTADDDGDALTYAWSVTGTGWTVTPNGAQASLRAPNAHGQSAVVTLVVSDAFGGSATATLQVSTSTNQPPVIQTLTAKAMPVLPGEPVPFQVHATDPDGDALSYSWSVSDPAFTISASGSNATVSAAKANNVSAIVTVTVSDGFGGSTQGSQVVTVASCAGSTMNCNGSAADGCEADLRFDESNCGACGVTCPASTYCGPGAVCYPAPDTFRLDSLSASSCSAIEHYFITGDDRGGIAVSNANVFYTGDSSTGRFALGTLASASTGTQYDALCGDLSTGQVYVLGSATGLIAGGAGTVTRLVEIDGDTGAMTANEIQLDTPIPVANGTGIFSGWGRIVLLSNGHAFDIRLPSGHVEDHSNAMTPTHTPCENWAFWGTAEFFGGELYVDYVQSPSAIARMRISDGAITSLATFSGLSDMCSFTFSATDSRWYWHHEGSSQFRSGDESIGYCAATYSHP